MTTGLKDLLRERLSLLSETGSRLQPEHLLDRDAPGGLRPPDFRSANRHCRLLQAREGWIALNLARPDDRDMVPALVGDEVKGDLWEAVSQTARYEDAVSFRDRAVELQLPVAIVGEVSSTALKNIDACRVPRRVIDMSALWAGPLCAGLLARCGAEVIRVESPNRPDPTRLGSPMLNRFLNGNKKHIALDLGTDAGLSALHELIRSADVLVTSARPAALSGLGITPELLMERAPGLVWLAITAHGQEGQGGNRVGFGDDCAAAGGLVDYVEAQPHFRGDALADPLTGLEGALAVLDACGRERTGLVDIAMSRVASGYAIGVQS